MYYVSGCSEIHSTRRECRNGPYEEDVQRSSIGLQLFSVVEIINVLYLIV